ncbi:ArsA family ATPase [Desertibacillus haloalkaliphilus]|uniref:ArsA family ATPase n=1 Tax=Desertibacillus haloalkaliphilus TaxID=1328930 RepID=UPI0028B073E1|nr:ArsA family ATPase [Desertibacillus haloalkaliphilus]
MKKGLLQRKVIFVGGKGGVGKSTSASALAMSAAKQGKRTLLVSTDPAHNIGDIFHTKIGSKRKKLTTHLWGLEIHPEEEQKKYIETVKDNLRGMIKPSMIDEIHRQIDMASVSPGADESALFDRIVSIILEEGTDFEHIIFDTAPTGHTIRLLSLPELMSAWVDGMLDRRKTVNENYAQWLDDGEPREDTIYQILAKRKDRFAKVREILLNPKKTGFVFVLIPERLPILETEKAVQLLEQYKINVDTLFVNKVIPPHADGQFLQKRRLQEQKYLEWIESSFKKQRIVQIPLYEEDINNLEALEQISTYLKETK